MAEQFLSQDEVDALLAGVNGDEPATPAADIDESAVQKYDVAQQERIVRGRMPTLEIINERFARNFRVGLFNFMRRNPDVSVGPVKVQKFSAFLSSVVVPTNINVVQVRPLRGNGLVICEPQLIFTIIDNLFGGSGKLHTRIEGRDFSPTEQRIIGRLLEVTLGEYNRAWAGVHPLELEYVRSEMQPQFANIATPSEIVVTTSFTIDIGESSGAMHVCIPYATLEPLRELLFSSMNADQGANDRSWLEKISQQIKQAQVELTAILGSASITCGELLGLKPGDFVELGIPETVVVKVNDTPVLDCRYGTSNGRYAVRVERFLTTPHETI